MSANGGHDLWPRPTSPSRGALRSGLTRWRRAERALRRELGRVPGFGEVADRLGLSAEQREMVRQAQRAGRARPAGPARPWPIRSSMA